jgi:hypothetical protein
MQTHLHTGRLCFLYWILNRIAELVIFNQSNASWPLEYIINLGCGIYLAFETLALLILKALNFTSITKWRCRSFPSGSVSEWICCMSVSSKDHWNICIPAYISYYLHLEAEIALCLLIQWSQELFFILFVCSKWVLNHKLCEMSLIPGEPITTSSCYWWSFGCWLLRGHN